MSSIERSLVSHIGNKDYTNIIFKSNNNNIIKRHLELLDNIYIDWNINKIDIAKVIRLIPTLSFEKRLQVYKHLLEKKLVVIFATLDFRYLWEYLEDINKLELLKDIILILNRKRYLDLYQFIRDKFRVYMYILDKVGKNELTEYLLDYFPESFLRVDDLYSRPKILKKLIMNFGLHRCRILAANYPHNLLIERLNSIDEEDIDFLTLFVCLPRIEYCKKYLKYIKDFTFDDMKRLVPLIYPCYICELSSCRGISYTLYLNLIEHMTHEQISFVLKYSNIETYLDIFSRLNKVQLLYGCNKIDEEKFWLSLKSVSFKNLEYFIGGIKESHKDIFLNKILDILDNIDIVKNLCAQYIVMCFTYRETFEYVINKWNEIDMYLWTIIFKQLDGKKMLRVCEICTLVDWAGLINCIEKYEVESLARAIKRLTILNRGSGEACNILHFCRTHERYDLLSHVFSILDNSE